jgi:hypothetical protein
MDGLTSCASDERNVLREVMRIPIGGDNVGCESSRPRLAAILLIVAIMTRIRMPLALGIDRCQVP